MDRKDKDLPMVNPEDTGEMELFFKTAGGVLITLEFHKEETVQAVLPKVQDTLGFDFIKRTIHLEYKGEQLEESEAVTLAQYGIKSGDTLEILVDAEKIEIFVRLENGDVLAIKINAQATVAALMGELAGQTGIASQEQYLLLGGEQLDPTSVLSRLGLQPENELELYPLRITLRITLSNRGTVRATVDRTLSYGELLNTIAPFEDTTTDFIRLTLDGTELNHNESLHEQGVTTDSELVSVKEVEVVVRLEEGEAIKVRLNVQSRMRVLMEELANTSGMLVDSQYLLFDGEQVEEDSTLDEFENHEFELFSTEVEVTVKLSNGDTVQVICKRSDNYSALRTRVANLEDTTPELVNLYFNSMELEEERTLHLQGIRGNSVVECQRMIKARIAWTIGSDINEFEVKLDSQSTVKDLREVLVKDYGMSSATQVLMFAQKEIDDEEKLDNLANEGTGFEVHELLITLNVRDEATGEDIAISIERTATFDKLKATVADLKGVAAEAVQLYFPRLERGGEAEEIEGDTTLHMLGVIDGEQVALTIRRDESDEDEDEEKEEIKVETTSEGGGGALLESRRSASTSRQTRRGFVSLGVQKQAKKFKAPPKRKPAIAPSKPPEPTAAKPPPVGFFKKRVQLDRKIETSLQGRRRRRAPPGAPAEQEVVVQSKAVPPVDALDSTLEVRLDELGFDDKRAAIPTDEFLDEEGAAVAVEEDKRAERAERRRERRRRVLAYIKDILRNVSMIFHRQCRTS